MFKFLNLFKRKQKATNNADEFGYDAVDTMRTYREHWRGADLLSPDKLNNALTRSILRSQARYEYNNNPWLFGLVNQVADDIIGTGARLQIEKESVVNTAQIERDFQKWVEEVKLTDILKNVKRAVARDGEAFIMLTTRNANKTKVKLFPLLFACDRVTTPINANVNDTNNIDGVFIDNFGVPLYYTVARQNPTETAVEKWDEIKAEYIIHFFNANYAEQHRGVPEFSSCLNDIGLLRRYTKAMLDKMENASNICGVLTPKDSLEAQIEQPIKPVESFKKFTLPSRAFVSLPLGYDLKQFELGNPTDSQQQFALSVKIDCARCLLATRNVVTGDSSNYNYASGRLDFQSYYRAINDIRHKMEEEILNKIFGLWYAEYTNYNNQDVPAHSWYWDGFAHVDPVKESRSETMDMANGSKTLMDVCAEHGKDWQIQVNNRLEVEKYEREQREKLGLPTLEEVAAARSSKGSGVTNDGE